jgi:hypothetical protein
VVVLMAPASSELHQQSVCAATAAIEWLRAQKIHLGTSFAFRLSEEARKRKKKRLAAEAAG